MADTLQVDRSLFDMPELFRFKMNEDQVDDPVIPDQIPTTSKQTTEITISSDQPGSPSLLLKLAVDASPGCGGIAWPAGSVSILSY